jgi:hypothetical protein
VIGLKAENYLLNCRLEATASPSKTSSQLFQTSPEHPNARIIINSPFGPTSPTPTKAKPVPYTGDIFDPQPPKRKPAPATDDNTRRSSRKRVQRVYEESSTEFTTDEDEPEAKRRKTRPSVKRTESKENLPQGSPIVEGRKRRVSAKLLDSTDTPKKKEEKGRAAGKVNREKEARLDRRENEELYEALQKQVTIDLLKRRGVPTNEQEEMVMDICHKLGLDQDTDLVTRAATSVRYWVAHKSWRLRGHLKFLGAKYKQQHRAEDYSNALPPISVVKPLVNQKEVERWLFQSLGMRLALRRMMADKDIRAALWTVFVAGLRYIHCRVS